MDLLTLRACQLMWWSACTTPAQESQTDWSSVCSFTELRPVQVTDGDKGLLPGQQVVCLFIWFICITQLGWA